MRNGQGISDRQLADRLKEFGIRSGTVRIGQQTFKGYTASEFTDAWDRYLPPSDPERHKRHMCPPLPPAPRSPPKCRRQSGDQFSQIRPF